VKFGNDYQKNNDYDIKISSVVIKKKSGKKKEIDEDGSKFKIRNRLFIGGS